jgi:choline monooxygenase
VDALDFEIDADVTRAETPPARFYCDPSVLERAKSSVFAPSWQLVADADELEESGSIRPVVLHEGLLDEPIVLTRDVNGALHALSNVCTHRGNVVAEAACKRKSLVCGYHGRRFDLDGTFRTMPGFEEANDFPRPEDDLARAHVATLGRLVFASTRPERPFAAWIGDLRKRLGWIALDDLSFDAERSREYEVKANWALYCDNYLEGFHIPFVHQALSATIELEEYTTELFSHSSVQIALAKDGEAAFEPPKSSPEHGRRIAGYYWFVFPNLMLNFYPWGLSINVVRPQAVDRTRVSFLAYVGDRSKLDRGAGAGLDRVEHEDEAVVESVQRGLRSSLYTRGRYSPKHERAVHHFHRLLLERLRG